MVSTKFYSGYDGDFIYAKEWAEYGNLSTERIQQLELEFLSAVNWNIYVSNQVFFEKLKSIECILAKRQGLKRGWLTYTELANLLPSIAIAKAFLQYSALFTVSYAASVVTIAGALFFASQVPGTVLYRSAKSSDTSVTNSGEKSMDTGLPGHNVHNGTTISTHVHLQTSPGCPLDTLDEAFERLNETFDDHTIPIVTYTKPSESRTTSIVIAMPEAAAFGQSIGIKTGVNLRSFLLDDGDDTNLTDGLDVLTNELQNYWQTLRYDLFYVWMTAF